MILPAPLSARELKAHVDLALIAGRFSRLRQSGRQLIGLCPLHSERVYGELLLRRATWHETLLHPFPYVIDFKCALSFGEAQPKSQAAELVT